jgi:uncharacterized protein YdhG (YjbR/CyaY superfamily)
MPQRYETVEAYIASFPPEVQSVLEEVRRTILAVVPTAEERISYQIPTVTLDGECLIYFAGWKRHISLYPVEPVEDDPDLAARLAPYLDAKATCKFPLDRPIPYDLITELVARAAQRRAAGDG